LLGSTSDEDYRRRMAKFMTLSSASPESLQNAMTLTEANATLKASKGGFWNTLTNTLSSPIDSIMGLFSDTAQAAGSSQTGAVATGIGIQAGATLGGWKLVKSLLARGGASAAAGAGEAAAAGGTVATGGGAAGLSLGGASFATETAVGAASLAGAATAGLTAGFGYLLAQGMPKYIQDWIETKLSGVDPNADYKLGRGSTLAGSMDDMTYWMSKGYSKDQAAGIIANMNRESGGDPGARGDGGRAHGLFQWHPDRRGNILRATGIDVSSGTYEQQREAAAWEMKNEGIFSDEYYRSIVGADKAGAYFSRYYERPANAGLEAAIRGREALGIASRYPGISGGGSTSITIGDINIQTQATDATGIAENLEQALQRELSLIQGKFDTGEQ
jgi:hypothetical protein